MPSQAVPFSRRTYSAKPFSAGEFKLSGTLDGFIDFAVPKAGTYQLSLGEARALIAALSGAVSDISANCLYDQDALLAETPR